MPDYKLFIAPAAKDDLTDIYQFGLSHWGKTQSDNYLAAIKDQFWMLIDQPLMGVERSELLLNTRSLTIQSHIVFYRVIPGLIEIIRVLHGRQDPQRHLSTSPE